MKIDKKISVIIPVYNLENYISDCLESVINQSYNELEIIVVNDGSKDKSEEICRDFAEKDSRIKLISKENGGLSAARNTGVAVATGDYISFVDGDDFIHKDYFKTLIECAEESGADVAVVKYAFTDSKEEYDSMNDLDSEKSEVISAREAALRIERDGERYMITAWGKLFNRNLKELLTFPVGKLHEDEFFSYRVLYSANKVVVSDCKFYGYLKRNGSIMGGFSKRRMEDALEGMCEAIDYFKEKKDRKVYCWAVRRYLFRILIDYYRIQNEMPDETELLETTQKLFNKEHKRLFSAARMSTAVTQVVAIRVFLISPKLYCRFCDVFLRHSKEER